MDAKPRKLLVIEDDPSAQELISPYLKKEGYEVVFASTGLEGLKLIESHNPNLMILDMNLPDIDGFEVLRRLQNSPYLPVIILTGREEATDKVVGLELGADDYITKPFHPRELLARIKAVLRRIDSASQTMQDEKITVGEVELDPKAQKLVIGNTGHSLTVIEYKIVEYLMQNKGHVLTREEILNHVWGDEFERDPRIVDAHIKRLREKFSTDQGKFYLQSVRGVGYKFEP